jgi:hypothetical protein
MKPNYLNTLPHNNKMCNYIIISSYLLGSFYLFSASLTLTNDSCLQDKKMSNKLIIINGLTMLVSGSIIVYNLTLLNSSYFKSSRV